MVFYRGSPKVKRRQKKIVDLQMSTLLQRDAKAIDNINRIRFALATALCGEGCWLIDETGRILDLSSSWGAANLGYGGPAVTQAVAAAAGKVPDASVSRNAGQ
jgi:4-aminobutyrate aminotransferase-like enzyme